MLVGVPMTKMGYTFPEILRLGSKDQSGSNQFPRKKFRSHTPTVNLMKTTSIFLRMETSSTHLDITSTSSAWMQTAGTTTKMAITSQVKSAQIISNPFQKKKSKKTLGSTTKTVSIYCQIKVFMIPWAIFSTIKALMKLEVITMSKDTTLTLKRSIMVPRNLRKRA